METRNLIAGVVVFSIAVFFVLESIRMPLFGEFYISPGFFPAIIGFVLLLLSLQLIVGSVISLAKYRNQKVEKENEGETHAFLRNKEVWVRTAVIVIAMIGYVALLSNSIFPYFVTTTLFLLITLFYFYPEKKIHNILLSFAVSICLDLVFSKVFLIPLP